MSSFDKIHIQIIDKLDQKHDLEFPNDSSYSLMEMLRAAELPVLGTCGGLALCASCHIYVLSNHDLDQMKEEEEQLLDSLHNSKSNSRLSCQLRIHKSLDGLVCQLATE